MSVKKNNDKDIEKAVREIPGLIYEEAHKKQPIENNPVYISPHNSKKWMWTGVIIFSLCIVTLWGLNIAGVLYETKNTESPTKDILKNSTEDLQNIIKTFGDNELEELTSLATTTQPTPTTTNKKIDEQTTTFLEKLSSLFTTPTTTSTTSTLSPQQ